MFRTLSVLPALVLPAALSVPALAVTLSPGTVTLGPPTAVSPIAPGRVPDDAGYIPSTSTTDGSGVTTVTIYYQSLASYKDVLGDGTVRVSYGFLGMVGLPPDNATTHYRAAQITDMTLSIPGMPAGAIDIHNDVFLSLRGDYFFNQASRPGSGETLILSGLTPDPVTGAAGGNLLEPVQIVAPGTGVKEVAATLTFTVDGARRTVDLPVLVPTGIAAPVPEPAALGMFGLAAGALTLLRRRRA